MSRLPRDSPWGAVQQCEQMIDGVFAVSTARHGGIMVRKNAADFLSADARKVAMNESNYLCYEEDCDNCVVMRELLDKQLWQIPDRISDKVKYEEMINQSLQYWNPEYWESRQKRLPITERLKDGADKAAVHNADATHTPTTRTDKLEMR